MSTHHLLSFAHRNHDPKFAVRECAEKRISNALSYIWVKYGNLEMYVCIINRIHDGSLKQSLNERLPQNEKAGGKAFEQAGLLKAPIRY